MNQNFAILGMFDRSNIMSVVNKQPSGYKFILAAVNSGAKPEEEFRNEVILWTILAICIIYILYNILYVCDRLIFRHFVSDL